MGSGALVQTLVANDLIDTYQIMLHPLLLGMGKRLFREYPNPVKLTLIGCTPTTTGVLDTGHFVSFWNHALVSFVQHLIATSEKLASVMAPSGRPKRRSGPRRELVGSLRN